MAKRVVRCRDLLISRWEGKGSYVNGLVKKGAGGRGKSSSYSLKQGERNGFTGGHVTLNYLCWLARKG